jgi:hypothetical protein
MLGASFSYIAHEVPEPLPCVGDEFDFLVARLCHAVLK